MKVNLQDSNRVRFKEVQRGEFFWKGAELYLKPSSKPCGDSGETPPESTTINLRWNRYETIDWDEEVVTEGKQLEIIYA